MMAQLMDRPVDTFSVGFKDYLHLNELDYAERVAKKFKTNHHEIRIDESDMRGYLDDLIHHQDEPIADWVCIPLYFVSKLAKDNGVTVVQVGEGSDEQFSGYASYMGYLHMYQQYWEPYRRLAPRPVRTAVAAIAKGAGRVFPKLEVYADILDRAARDREHFWSGATVFWDTLKSQLVQPGSIVAGSGYEAVVDSGMMPASYLEPDTFNVIRSFVDRMHTEHPGHDILSRMVYNEFKLRLPELLLMRVDKITMATSIEARVPFLDHLMVEFSMNIPSSMKLRNGNLKNVLKQALRGILPDEIIDRKKIGFAGSGRNMMTPEIYRHARSLLLSPRHDYYNLPYIRALLDEYERTNINYTPQLWTLYNFELWHRWWIEGDRGLI